MMQTDNPPKYRIFKYKEGYIIKVKVYWTEGILWWRKEVSGWVDIDHDGRPNYPHPPHQGFNNLDKAREYAAKLVKDNASREVYYDVDTAAILKTLGDKCKPKPVLKPMYFKDNKRRKPDKKGPKEGNQC